MLLAERFGNAVITLSVNDEIIREQDPEDKVWERAEQDLKDACNYLDDYTSADEMSLQAAQALLARLYLNRGVLTSNAELIKEAGNYASKVLSANTSLELNPDYMDNFASHSIGNLIME